MDNFHGSRAIELLGFSFFLLAMVAKTVWGLSTYAFTGFFYESSINENNAMKVKIREKKDTFV